MGEARPAKKISIVPIVVVAAALFYLLAHCDKSEGDKSNDNQSEPSSSSVSLEPPARAEAPMVIPFPITLAEQKNGITIDAVDVGQHIVDGVNSQRAIFDRSNWRVVAQCDQMVGNTLKAGAIKSDEFATISAAGQGSSIADNSLKGILDCP